MPSPRVPIERRVHLPARDQPPLVYIARRVAFAFGLILFVALVAYLDRDGYVDAKGDDVSFLDALYYATVSVTTTGYGDIRPESDQARLLSTILVTPARVLFLIVLVGTTLEVLAERTRTAFRVARWRRRLTNHVIVCGYGTKGRSAVRSLLGHGVAKEDIVVIDESPRAREQAESDGLAVVAGSGASTEVLRCANVGEARAIIVAPNRDDTAVLITLTAREHNRNATIVSAVREEENAHLLRESGADSVIVSSGAAGRLLGVAIETPRLAEVLEDLLTVGHGLDLAQAAVERPGPLREQDVEGPVVAVVRDGELHRFDDERVADLQAGDHVIYLRTATWPASRPTS
jgi:voltage-gated potassium channel